ncbi:MAG: EAL domain-containing protein [Gammaproteobacteria bacterium]
MPKSLPEAAAGGIEILIVEDSPTQALQLTYLLKQNGYHVTTAFNGRQALEILTRQKPQIIISDVIMPEMDGYELCRSIKSDKTLEGIPVILVTSLSDLQGIMKGLECGADNFIRKPYDAKYLLSRIDYLLMNRVLRRTEKVQIGMEIYLLGKRHFITVERQQILDLLISVYEEAVHMNEELETRQKELAQSNQTLNSLYRIADGLNRAVSVQEVIEQSMESAMELPGIQSCWLALYEEDAGFRVASVRNLPLELSSPGVLEGDCLCRRQLLSGELNTAINVIDCERIGHLGQDSDIANRHISIPIKISNRPLGVMNLLQMENHRLLNEDELKTLHGIGNQIATALVRAQTHEQLEQLVQKRTAALLAEIAEHKRTENTLLLTEKRLDSILSSITDVIWSISAVTHQLQYLNPAAERIYGRPRAEFFTNTRLWYEMVYPEDRESISEYSKNLFSDIPGSLEYRIVKPDGEIRWLYDRAQLVRGEDGKPLRIDGITTDITVSKRHQASIMRLNRIYAVLSGINTAIVHIRDRRQLLAEACKIATDAGGFQLAWIGLTRREHRTIQPVALAGAASNYLEEIRDSADGEILNRYEPMARAFREGQPYICNNVAGDPLLGRCRPPLLRHNLQAVVAFPLTVMNHTVGGFALYASELNFFDEEEMKLLAEMAGDIAYALENIEKERQLNHLACFDRVTDLPNRTLLNDRLGQLLPKIRQRNNKLAVLLLDIDRFKFINDSLGYHAGDTLLKAVAQRLVELIPANDSLSRGVADDFVILMTHIDDLGDIAKFINDTLMSAFSRPFEINGKELRITFKAGISVFPGDAENTETLLTHAEVALDKAKHSMNTFLFYLPEMNASVSKILLIENKLRKAIEQKQFLLHYQPKLDIKSGRICGLEALIRWQDPENGLIPPMEFIPILEETGMILDVGHWVIETVCRHLNRWKEKGWMPPSVAVNVSSLQLTQDDFVRNVGRLIKRYGVNGRQLEFEITESVIMQDVAKSIEKLNMLTKLGSEISVDDFGTGYSSLSYLTRLPLKRLKIDKSFINEVSSSSERLTIVSSVIALAHELNLKVIAEGVETGDQLDLLRRLNCDEIQGYIAYRPMPLMQLEDVLAREFART